MHGTIAVLLMYFVTLPLYVTPSTLMDSSIIENSVTNTSMPSNTLPSQASEEVAPEDTPCTCGVFLSSQFKKGSKDQPKGDPVLTQEIDTPFTNNALGNKHCTHRCLEAIIKHLPKSSDIICATVEREDVHREKAYLFVKNHSDKWHATNFSAGREFCCKDHVPYKCSKVPR